MKHRGLGKKLIYKMFVISEQEQYELLIVDMVNSFYQKMIARGICLIMSAMMQAKLIEGIRRNLIVFIQNKDYFVISLRPCAINDLVAVHQNRADRAAVCGRHQLREILRARGASFQ